MANHCLLGQELTFIHPDDATLHDAWDSRAFELQVANHELLGHGSGKIFQEGADGKKNFDPAKVNVDRLSLANKTFTSHCRYIDYQSFNRKADVNLTHFPQTCSY